MAQIPPGPPDNRVLPRRPAVFDPYRKPWEKPPPREPEPVELRVVGGRGFKDPDCRDAKKLKRRTLENLTPKMKDRRDRFIAEFLLDWNGPAAYIRSGGPSSTASKMASEFLREPYVASRIWEVIDNMDEAELVNRKRVLAMLLREANYYAVGASHGARVSALSKIATILGMDQVKVRVDGQIDHNVRGGVMVIPMPASPEQWEQAAVQSQKQLTEHVRE